MKNPRTLAGIEPATFRFVARHLNHCATAVPLGLATVQTTIFQLVAVSKTEVLDVLLLMACVEIRF